jgi:translocator protein
MVIKLLQDRRVQPSMNHSLSVAPRHRQWPVLAAWLLFTFAASLGAVFVSTGGWYDGINKPDFTPPSWVFGPAWTTLYVLMGVAAWLVWREGGWIAQSGPLGLFVVQWVFNAIWTPLFFGAHWIGLALVDIVLLWLLIVATLIAFWRVRALAGALLLPYLGWVTFATALNFAIWRLNG